jgi:hypothetical protein
MTLRVVQKPSQSAVFEKPSESVSPSMTLKVIERPSQSASPTCGKIICPDNMNLFRNETVTVCYYAYDVTYDLECVAYSSTNDCLQWKEVPTCSKGGEIIMNKCRIIAEPTYIYCTATPEVTPEKTPVATPEVTPSTTPEKTPVATPEVTPYTTPERTPERTPARTPAATPMKTPAATPMKTPALTRKPILFANTLPLPGVLIDVLSTNATTIKYIRKQIACAYNVTVDSVSITSVRNSKVKQIIALEINAQVDESKVCKRRAQSPTPVIRNLQIQPTQQEVVYVDFEITEQPSIIDKAVIEQTVMDVAITVQAVDVTTISAAMEQQQLSATAPVEQSRISAGAMAGYIIAGIATIAIVVVASVIVSFNKHKKRSLLSKTPSPPTTVYNPTSPSAIPPQLIIDVMNRNV